MFAAETDKSPKQSISIQMGRLDTAQQGHRQQTMKTEHN